MSPGSPFCPLKAIISMVRRALAKPSQTGQHSPSGMTTLGQFPTALHINSSHIATPLSHTHTRQGSGFQMSWWRWTSPSTVQLSARLSASTVLSSVLGVVAVLEHTGQHSPAGISTDLHWLVSSQIKSSQTTLPMSHTHVRQGSWLHTSLLAYTLPFSVQVSVLVSWPVTATT